MVEKIKTLKAENEMLTKTNTKLERRAKAAKAQLQDQNLLSGKRRGKKSEKGRLEKELKAIEVSTSA